MTPCRSPAARSRTALVAVLVTVLVGTLVSAGAPQPRDGPARPAAAGAAAPGATRAVVVVSLDGLTPIAIRRLGRAGTPALHRLIARGASTMNARTVVEQTNTLPNHTSMMTSRRVEARRGGHGITFNEDRGGTVQDRAGGPVQSVFDVVRASGRRAALFATKSKFDLLARSWEPSIGRYTRLEDNTALARLASADLRRTHRAFTFVHLSRPDLAGHDAGWLSRPYLRAVRRADRDLGRVARTMRRDPWLRAHAVLVVTADHGGRGTGHDDTADPRSFRIPFIVRGRGVPAGSDLYRLNRDYARPGARQPSYAARRQPVRNAVVANLAADLLGLPALANSELNARQNLDVRRPARR